MNRKNKIKAIIAIAVALAFILPTSAAFASDDSDINNMVESTNSDNGAPLGPTTLNVGPGHPYATIQAAIDAANPAGGDTVYVHNGMYPEQITIDKQLNLIGESRAGVIISGTMSKMSVVDVAADYVNIADLSVTMAIMFGISIVGYSHCTVTNCDLGSTMYFQLYLELASDNTFIDCDFHDPLNPMGVGLMTKTSSDNTFIDCKAYNCGLANFIVGNSPGYTFTNCKAWGSASGYGIRIVGGESPSHSDNYIITNFEAYDNNIGISIGSSSGGIITDCNIHDNIANGIKLEPPMWNHDPSINTLINQNNVVNNGVNGYDDVANGALNQWDDGVAGNFWSDYGGVDADGNGIGDTPYLILNGASLDNYPLMSPAPYVPTFVSVLPDPKIVAKGTSFDVEVYIEPSEAVCGVEIYKIYYDENFITATGVTYEGFFDPYATMTTTPDLSVPGVIEGIGEFTLGTETVTDPNVFCTISFTADEFGTSAIDLEEVDITRPDATSVPLAVKDGEVIVTIFYDLDISHVGDGATIPATGVHSYVDGTVVDLTATADLGWTFDSWTGDVAAPGSATTTITMNDDKVVSALFTEDCYDLVITPDGNGHVVVDPLETCYLYGEEPELTAVADPGWTFDHWSGDLSGDINPTTIFMDDDKVVTATFTEDCYILAVSQIGEGLIVIDPLETCYLYGETVTLTETAEIGWEFGGWSGDDAGDLVPVLSSWTILMDDDKDLTATFDQVAWDATLAISGTVSLGITDTVVFGEKELAENGIDEYDIVKSPTPPEAPYVYAWLATDLDVPYDFLWEDYRHLGDENTWDLWIETDGDLDRVEITITWNPADVAMGEYDYVGLYDMLTGHCVVPDMTSVGTYSYWADNGMAYWFQIRTSMNHPLVANDDDYKTNENTVLTVDAPGVLGNDVDPDGDDLWVSSMDTISTLGGSITWVDDGSFVYTPPVGVSDDTDSFTYTATDGTFSDSATVFVEIVALNSISVKAGWNLFSIPIGEDIDKTTIIVEYDSDWHTWDEAIINGKILGFTYGWQAGGYTDGKGNTLVPGEGYWMWAFEDCDLLIPSNDPTDNHITYLDEGWNLVGVHEEDLDKTYLCVQYDGEYRLWTYAVSHGIILDFVYDWDRAGQTYALSNFFDSGYGYWVYAYQGCALKEPL